VVNGCDRVDVVAAVGLAERMRDVDHPSAPGCERRIDDEEIEARVSILYVEVCDVSQPHVADIEDLEVAVAVVLADVEDRVG
jgi:hypothetical protein